MDLASFDTTILDIMNMPVPQRSIRILPVLPKNVKEARNMYPTIELKNIMDMDEMRVRWLEENDSSLLLAIYNCACMLRKRALTQIYTSPTPSCSEIDRILASQGNRCAWCFKEFDYTDPFPFVCDRLESGFGKDGEAHLFRDREGSLLRTRHKGYLWLQENGYKDNFQVIRKEIQYVKCVFMDKWKIATALLSDDATSMGDIHTFYNSIEYDACSDCCSNEGIWNDWICTFLFKRPLPKCPLTDAGGCNICSEEVSSCHIWDGVNQTWKRSCQACYYPQVNAIRAVDKLFIRFVKYGETFDVDSVIDMLSKSKPLYEETDILEHVIDACYALRNRLEAEETC